MKKNKFKKLISVFLFAVLSFGANSQTQFWGTSYGGGLTSGDHGNIFVANNDGSNLHKVYTFDSINGMSPASSLVLANGKLFGVTYLGGNSGSCVIFSYEPSTGNYALVHDEYLNPNTGWMVMSGLTLGTDGFLYGLCSLGGMPGGSYMDGGVIFKIDPATNIYTDLYDFNYTVSNLGLTPDGMLTQLSDGKLYGVTHKGGSFCGSNGCGIIFNFDPTSRTFTKLYDFDGTSGYAPLYSKLLACNDGKLYGLSSSGGSFGNGTLYSFDPSNDSLIVLHNYDGVNDGSHPNASVIQATDGNLYGMTYDGGSNNFGVIFRYNISSNTYSTIFNFDNVNGANPQRDLMQASNGKLYGTTKLGGTNGVGVAFTYDITTNTFTKIADFNSSLTGTSPDCMIIETPAFANVGIQSVSMPATTISINPNPFSSQTNITFGVEQTNATVKITDILGKEIKALNFSGKQLFIEKGEMKSGIYFLQITDEKKSTVNRKIVVQ